MKAVARVVLVQLTGGVCVLGFVIWLASFQLPGCIVSALLAGAVLHFLMETELDQKQKTITSSPFYIMWIGGSLVVGFCIWLMGLPIFLGHASAALFGSIAMGIAIGFKEKAEVEQEEEEDEDPLIPKPAGPISPPVQYPPQPLPLPTVSGNGSNLPKPGRPTSNVG